MYKKKHKFRKIFTCLMLICTLVCSSVTPIFAVPRHNNPVSSQSFNKAREHSVTIHAGEKKLLSILYIGASWSSSDRSVVTVKNGVITGVGPGTATVTAKSWIFGTEKWNVTVKEENIKDRGNVSIKVDEKKLLSIVYLCADWTSTDNSIVTVKHGVITGKSEGEAIVTAKSLLLGSAKWTVTVESNEQHTEHIWNNGITTTPATCVNEGVITYTCTVCGETKTESIPIDPDNHEKIITDSKEPTCTEDGTETVKCDACGKVISETKLPATGHVWDQGTIVTEATCVKEGKVIFTCEKCGEKVEKTIPIDPQNHENVTTETTEPTCTEGGRKAEVCKDCGVVINETVLPAKGHTEVKEHKDPTETEDGYDRVVCSVCGEILSETIISATGHKWDDGVVTKEATCVEEGAITFTCKDCKETYTKLIPIDPDNHANVSTKKTDPTCTEDGVEITYCADCGTEIKKTTIPAVGHDWKKNSTTAATCVTEGKIIYMCNNCGDTKEEAIPVDPDNHINVSTKETEPTCTEDGKITIFCSDCEKVLNEESIAATGHSWVDGTVTKEPTCVAEGEKTYTCANCGQTQTDVLPVDPDNHKNITTKTEEATCTEDGVTVTYCKDCNTVIKQETIPAKGHTEVKEHKDPTATEDGYDRVVCSVCGTVIRETVIPATGETEPEENIVIDLVVKNGKVLDLVSGKELAGAEVSGEYFSGGTVSLPSSYTAASIEAVLQYNRESREPAIGNGLSYYGGAFLFQEILNPVNTGLIKVPFGGGQTGTNFRLHASINYDKPVLGDGDSYWCLAFDADSDSYALQINNDYYEKQHWSNYINKSFTLSDEHKFKEFTVYSEKLSREEISEHFKDTGISVLSEDDTTVGRVTDGISDLGSAIAFTKEGAYGIPEWLETNKSAGDYTLDDMNGLDLPYTISDYKEPDNGVDNSAYTSVHIIKKPETLYTSYKYALSAVPYPFNVNHDGKSDQYDISWLSSDKSVAAVIDGLVIPKKAGTVTITAKLAGTNISDSCTIKIIDKAEAEDRVFKVEESYTSENGNRFSETDYEMTTNAIYDAIAEAYENGYNHVVFPEIDFYAAPIGETYYIPTGMTVEFPEGSAFHMMPSKYAENDGYTYFRMGWDWYDYNIPTDTAYKELDEDGNVLGYYCRDAHLIIDQYYGEFYKAGAAIDELSDGANDYSWSCVLLDIGRKAQYCSVEVHEAQCPAGFFIVMGGKAGSQALANGGSTGSIKGTDFVSGWLDDSGELVQNGNWISTGKFFTAEKGANGTDPLHEYFLGNWEENITEATQRLYDILWYDEDYNLIEADRWQYTDEKYTKPDDAVYFKVSVQQSELPDTEGEYLRIHEDASSKFCEIKDTNVINGADGLASVVGATEACWIHDNYVSNDGLLSGSYWSLDLEDGWLGMRGTVIENNIFRKYAYSSNVGVYRGMDSGILALSSGYNTFVISNYIGAISQSNGNATNTHIINNAVYTMFGSISGGTASDIRPKIWAHVYYNIIGDSNIKENVSDNGVVYHYGNSYEPAINQW